MHEEHANQLPLFSLPNGAVAPKMRPKPQKLSGVKYSKCRPARRTLCHDCIRDIHTRGVAIAPLPRAVMWRRVDVESGEVDLLCDNHCRIRKGES